MFRGGEMLLKTRGLLCRGLCLIVAKAKVRVSPKSLTKHDQGKVLKKATGSPVDCSVIKKEN